MSIKYRPEIDGLRAIAVIPVILFHMGFSWIKGGFYGVDVFFVISGFLITSNILRNLDQDKFSFKDFWIKRAKRILPALYTMIFIVLLLAPFLIFKGDIPALVTDAVPAIFSYSNFHSLFAFGNYWGGTAEQSFFLHCWSLSVEEQFYLFYPFLLYFLFRKKRNIKMWLVGIIVISFLLFIIGSYKFPQSTFYLLPTRAWELAAGALISIIKPNDVKNKFSGIFSSFGLILIFLSYFVFPGSGSVSIFGILPVLGSAMFILYSTQQSFVKNIISNPVIVYIGKISYSLYLWHWPIILIAKYYEYRFSHIYLNVGIVCLTFVLSILSYHLVEKRTRFASWTPKFALSLGIVTILSCIFLKSDSFDKTYKNDFNKVIFYGLYYDISPTIKEVSEINKAKREGIIAPIREDYYKNAYKNGGMTFGKSDSDSKTVVIGDSHGAMWAKVLREISDEMNTKISFYTSVGNSPFYNINDVDNQQATKSFTQKERIDYAQNLKNKIDDCNSELIILACRWETISKKDWQYFEDLLQYLKSKDKKVLILNQPPVTDSFIDKNSVQYLSFLGFSPNNKVQFVKILNEKKVLDKNQSLEKLKKKYENINIFNVYKLFSKNDSIKIISSKDVLYYDDDQLSYQGTQIVTKALGQKVKSIL
ncbi:acyltransferase family protein [Epilithonimonas ginsengisoli]|uniref:Acyltransferase family protein n=1 Tax=Epilithonimonas ginsengisoli TaxID=1245592 RepID=A0ABU4JIK4_9FLAO|nr:MULTISPECIES: acyltransferase family protein [Chryseobacterium group]MBV6879089.1 acyltransferase [Epilithonimonas sp. FP105]MDW8549523.1 acyltransferase family protein [Epilithonimonas ginsengisoli]